MVQGWGWGTKEDTRQRCKMTWPESVTVLTRSCSPQHMRRLQLKLRALGNRAKLRRASA